MKQNQKIARFPENGANCEPCEMVAIPLLETSLWCGPPTDFPDLGHNPVTKHVLVPADIVKNPEQTFAFKTKGDSMEPILYEDDYLIADSSRIVCLTKAMNEIVIAWYDGLTVKWLKEDGKDLYLVPENKEKYETQMVNHNSNFYVAGVVIYRIRAESIKDVIARNKK